MAEKRRATTFVTSRGAIINVAAPSVYIAPGVTPADVTSSAELREELREQIKRQVWGQSLKIHEVYGPHLEVQNLQRFRGGVYAQVYPGGIYGFDGEVWTKRLNPSDIDPAATRISLWPVTVLGTPPLGGHMYHAGLLALPAGSRGTIIRTHDGVTWQECFRSGVAEEFYALTGQRYPNIIGGTNLGNIYRSPTGEPGTYVLVAASPDGGAITNIVWEPGIGRWIFFTNLGNVYSLTTGFAVALLAAMGAGVHWRCHSDRCLYYANSEILMSTIYGDIYRSVSPWTTWTRILRMRSIPAQTATLQYHARVKVVGNLVYFMFGTPYLGTRYGYGYGELYVYDGENIHQVLKLQQGICDVEGYESDLLIGTAWPLGLPLGAYYNYGSFEENILILRKTLTELLDFPVQPRTDPLMSLAITDNAAHTSEPTAMMKNTNSVVIVNNGLDKGVSIQVQGDNEPAFTNPQNIGAAFTVATVTNDYNTIPITDRFNWFRIVATCTVAPASGTLTVRLGKYR